MLLKNIWKYPPVPVFGDNGEVIEAVHFIRDITERKLMEEGRRKADAQLRDALRFNQEVISNAERRRGCLRYAIAIPGMEHVYGEPDRDEEERM